MAGQVAHRFPRTDTFIEKDMAINDRIDKMRLSATRSLLERDDVRDLGDLKTSDGRMTRIGAIVRSDTPARLTETGWSALYAVFADRL